MCAYEENRLGSAANEKEAYMKQKGNFEKKDWAKAAKAFAKQAYGKKKLEAMKQERRFDIRKVEWDDQREAWDGSAVEFNTCIFFAGDDLEVLFSIHDQLLYRVTISADLLDRIFAGTLTNASPISNLYARLYADAVSNGNIKTAVGVATFSVKKDIRKEAAVLAKGLADVDDENKGRIIAQLKKQP